MKPLLLPLLVAALFASLASAPAQPRPGGPGALRPGPGPRVGELAPDFKLKTLDGKAEAQLASFKGKRPVLLVFGSYT